MKILKSVRTGDGSSIKGEAVMLSRYGNIVNVIDNKYHPNPGPKEEGYPEIERCIDWCLLHYMDCKPIYKNLDVWIATSVWLELLQDSDESLEDVTLNVMYSDAYTPCKLTQKLIKGYYELYSENPPIKTDVKNFEERRQKSADNIVHYINEKFMRVRAGGKLNPEGTDSIYFRISSHGFDWHKTIENFLWDVFKDPKRMPRRIWVGHDAENNPPEITLFDGTPEEFLNSDDRIFEKVSYK